jgi:BLOC-1-related complex sub-unit 7
MAASGWNQETKARLTEKVAVNMNDLASLARQVIRGSKSNEVNFSSRRYI